MKLSRADRRALGRLPPLEKDFGRQVIGRAKLRGWRVAHFRSVRVKRKDGTIRWQTPVEADGAGFPDLLLVHPGAGRLIVAELKVPPNTTSPAQRAWLAWFEACGVPAYTWTPADWPEIEAVIEAR